MTSKGNEAVTSDRWHVVHSRFVGGDGDLPYRRFISSEHDDRRSCVRAATTLLARIAAEGGPMPMAERDEVFARRPGFKSLKVSKRRAKAKSTPDAKELGS